MKLKTKNLLTLSELLHTSEDEEQKPDKEETKPKKKRGRFGLFRK
jgi:hypothetical protein